MLSTSEFKNGKVIVIEGELYYIVFFQHIKPGKGGAFVRTKLKSIKLDTVIDRTFKSGEKFEEAFIEEKTLQYLYHSAKHYHFMDQTNYESLDLEEGTVSDCTPYLKENMEVIASLYKGKIIGVRPPMFVELEIAETEPGVKGDTAKGGTKPAKLATGLSIQVPLFINPGDVIKIDTRTGEYVGRV